MNLGEVLDVLARHRGLGVEAISEKLSWLTAGGLDVVAVDERTGLLAGELHARHCDRATRAVSMADCLALATASLLGERLATSDPPLAEIARAEGCEVIALPDAGSRPATLIWAEDTRGGRPPQTASRCHRTARGGVD